MRDATYNDAMLIAKLLKQDQERVWILIKGIRFAALTDLIRLTQDVLQNQTMDSKL